MDKTKRRGKKLRVGSHFPAAPVPQDMSRGPKCWQLLTVLSLDLGAPAHMLPDGGGWERLGSPWSMFQTDQQERVQKCTISEGKSGFVSFPATLITSPTNLLLHKPELRH